MRKGKPEFHTCNGTAGPVFRFRSFFVILPVSFLLGAFFTGYARSETQQFYLMVTGQTDATLEVCGCRRNPAGGLARRAAAIQRYREAGLEVLPVETGDFLTGGNPLDLGRAMAYLSGLAAIGYGPVLLGDSEFRHGRQALDSILTTVHLPFLAANVRCRDATEPLWKSSWEGEIGGLRIGVIGLSKGPDLDRANLSGWEILPIEEALNSELKVLKERVHLIMVLSDLGPQVMEEINEKIPGFSLVANQGHLRVFERLPRGGIQVYAALDGVSVRAVRVRMAPGNRIPSFSVQDILLEPEKPEDAQIRALIEGFYQDVASNPEYAWKGFPHLYDPSSFSELHYVGSDECRSCHQRISAHWYLTRHANALITLQKKQRYFVPRCVGCHVVGFGEPSGYGAEVNPLSSLAHVGCEACHGPASAHLADPAIRVPIPDPGRDTCIRCHDQENSPEFALKEKEYFREVQHPR